MSSQSKRRLREPIYELLSPEDRELYQTAWDLTRAHHGYGFTFYLPGMIRCGRVRGRYPAISLTGARCELQCAHCKGRLLEGMEAAEDPATLLRAARRFLKNGAHGLLLTGGSDKSGRLPWKRFAGTIREIRGLTGLFISAHVGFPDRETCHLLKKSGISQALIDVMGDEETATAVYHLSGLTPVVQALDAIGEGGLQLIPHIVAGLYYGEMRGEYHALDLIAPYEPTALVIVVLTPFSGTPMKNVTPPSPVEVGRLIAHARLRMPHVPISLGCERPRNRDGWKMEQLAIQAGATRMAVWSDEALSEVRRKGLHPRFQVTCCSVPWRADCAIRVSSSG